MIKTSLCYIEKADQLLMLYRNTKINDPNAGKWIGVGGKFKAGETSDECMLREVHEETGLILTEYSFLGVIKFISDSYEDEEMYLYIGKKFKGELNSICDEGRLSWIDIAQVAELPLWEGDKCFLEPLIHGETEINMTLQYEADRLVSCNRY